MATGVPRLALILLALGGILITTPAQAKRVALVIGNSAYKHAPELKNPKNDATDLAAALKALGVEVIEGLDLDKPAMDRKIREFSIALAGAEAGIFFYSGHGLQVSRRNYLVPIDAELSTQAAVDTELVAFDDVVVSMERTDRTSILFLDASRPNPFAGKLARSMGARSAEAKRGLSIVRPAENMLIGHSTVTQYETPDASGRNSAFAGALIKHISTSNKELGSLLSDVRSEVMKETDSVQVPVERSNLSKPFYFSSSPAPESPRVEPQGPRRVASDTAKRLALVVGMSDYVHLRPLLNPANDARLIARTLTALGFEVTEVVNGTRNDLESSIKALVAHAQQSKEPVITVYMAGHGIQVDGLNYFLPVDALINKKEDVGKTAIDVEWMIGKLETTGSEVIHLLLDACSNEPFRQPLDIGQGRGLAAIDVRAVAGRADARHYNTVEVPDHFAFGLAAQPGHVALDGEGENSPYAQALSQAMKTEGWSSQEVLIETSKAVAQRTGEAQVPWHYYFIPMDFYFRSRPAR